MGLIPVTWDAVTVCLSAQAVLKWREYERLILSSLEHADDTHLYYNMLSFLVKGKSLEQRFGSPYFAYLLCVFTVLTSAIYVALQVVLTELTNDLQFYKTCAIGFSGVIFALKVLTTHYSERRRQLYFGISIPDKYAVWVELIGIQLMVPNASFTGHLSGILVGILYTQGPLKLLMDLPVQVFSCFSSETYHSQHTNWGSGVSGRHSDDLTDADYDEAIRRSYETMQTDYPARDSISLEEYDEIVQQSFESLQEDETRPDLDDIRRRRLARFL